MEVIKPVQQAFGSPGGKSYLAPKITGMIPPHKSYIEPFAGGAAVYFRKEPSQIEILNDKDTEIAFAFRFLRDMTPEQYAWLQRQNWVISRSQFDKVKAMQPKDDEERFYKFYYLKKGSFANKAVSVALGHLGHIISLDRLMPVHQRLKRTSIQNKDAMKLLDKYDSPTTFFYLDPPYPGRSAVSAMEWGTYSDKDLMALIQRLKHIKGKFALSLGTEHTKFLPQSWHIKRVYVRRNIVSPVTKLPIPSQYEIIATNYDTANAVKPSGFASHPLLKRGKHKVNRRRWHPIHPQLATCRSRG